MVSIAVSDVSVHPSFSNQADGRGEGKGWESLQRNPLICLLKIGKT
jgi:hypothetical protein